MKKVNGFLVSFLMTIAAIGFTSCDNDYYDGYYDGNYYGDHNRNNSAICLQLYKCRMYYEVHGVVKPR